MKIIHLALLLILLTDCVLAQKEPKIKEIKYELEFDNNTYKGQYNGSIVKGTINGKERNGPGGVGTFRGKMNLNENEDLWLVYEGAWMNGEMDGQGVLYTLTLPKDNIPSGTELLPGCEKIQSIMQHQSNYKIDGLNKVKVYGGYDKLNCGIFKNNALNDNTGIIETRNYSYEGEVKNGLPNGKGKMDFRDSYEEKVNLASEPYRVKSFHGEFLDGNYVSGEMKLTNGGILNGEWKNVSFTGSGALTFNDVFVYNGEWLNSNIQGKGKLTKKEDYEFVGTFADNKPTGEGTMIQNNGTKFKGKWTGLISQEKVSLEVQGTYQYISPKGYILEGYNEKNTFVGKGEYEMEDRAIYKGTVTIEGIKIISGQGTLTYPNGDVLPTSWERDGYTATGRRNLGETEYGVSLYEEGTFRNGKLHGFGKQVSQYSMYDLFGFEFDDYDEPTGLYEGMFINGLKNGTGSLVCDLGFQFVNSFYCHGNWENNNLVNGKIQRETNGESSSTIFQYEGPVTNFKPSGFGIVKLKETEYFSMYEDTPNLKSKEVSTETTYTGSFSNGSPNGTGKFEYSDGRIYEGEVKDGKPHGRGTMTLKNKKVQTGNFVYGEFKIP